MAPNLLTLLDSGQPIFYTAIFENLNPQDTVRLLATCRQTHALTKHIFNVNVLLRPFFTDPLAFRQVMADNDLIVGGSMALRLFSREKWQSSDVDVYTKSQGSVPIVAKFLVKEGYQFKPYAWQAANLEKTLRLSDSARQRSKKVTKPIDLARVGEGARVYENVMDVYAFVHEKTGRKVEVILAEHTILKVILSYYATYVMNFFSYRTAFSLFASMTFRKKLGFYVPLETLSIEPGERTLRAVAKYHDRGYKIHNMWSDEDKVFVRSRTVGDCDTWVLPLSLDGIKAPTSKKESQGTEFIVRSKLGAWRDSVPSYGDFERDYCSILVRKRLEQADSLILESPPYRDII
ncbi:hypothetical protein TWF730_003709 [Orbilia blumenaviensis]|uniref:F-box domain-containing protein n=1 Tax=Orbilia blumenaviensis TaxID=1796055 RepID=A0AAV9U4E5_9PEZI